MFTIKCYAAPGPTDPVACNTGSALYPNATGGFNSWPAATYYNTNPITIRTWSGDPRCGILDSQIIKLTPEVSCAVDMDGYYSGGVLWRYNSKDNSCNLPLDDYIPFAVLICGGLGFIFIQKNRLDFIKSRFYHSL